MSIRGTRYSRHDLLIRKNWYVKAVKKNNKRSCHIRAGHWELRLELWLLVACGGNPVPIGSGTVGSRFSNEVTRNQYFPAGIFCFPGFWLHSQDRVTSHSGKDGLTQLRAYVSPMRQSISLWVQ